MASPSRSPGQPRRGPHTVVFSNVHVIDPESGLSDIRNVGVTMDAPPEESEPLVRTDVGIRDLASAVQYILKQRDITRLNLVAMSWGGSVAGAYIAVNNEKIAKLALVAPLWLLKGPAPIDAGGRLAAYRKVPVLEFRERWLSAAPEAARPSLIPAGGFEVWANISLATDAKFSAGIPPLIRAVNGPILAFANIGHRARPCTMPTTFECRCSSSTRNGTGTCQSVRRGISSSR